MNNLYLLNLHLCFTGRTEGAPSWPFQNRHCEIYFSCTFLNFEGLRVTPTQNWEALYWKGEGEELEKEGERGREAEREKWKVRDGQREMEGKEEGAGEEGRGKVREGEGGRTRGRATVRLAEGDRDISELHHIHGLEVGSDFIYRLKCSRGESIHSFSPSFTSAAAQSPSTLKLKPSLGLSVSLQVVSAAHPDVSAGGEPAGCGR